MWQQFDTPKQDKTNRLHDFTYEKGTISVSAFSVLYSHHVYLHDHSNNITADLG
jgi:hypothetical protein